MGVSSRAATGALNHFGLAGRIQFAVIGAILTAVGSIASYRSIQHEMFGVDARAEIVEIFDKCIAVHSRSGRTHNETEVECANAKDLEKFVGADRVAIRRQTFARLGFAAASGERVVTDLETYKLSGHRPASGDAVSIVYDAGNPNAVMPKLGLSQLKMYGGLLLLGFALLAFAFFDKLVRR